MFGWRRKTTARKKQQSSLDKEFVIPEHFRCPISLDLMKDPVSLSSGITYDRESIERWLDEGNFTCPVTNQVLRNFDRIPNHTLRKMIQDWCEENRNFGVERIPTPKVPVTGTEVSEVLFSIEGSMQRLDQCGFLESLNKIKKWGLESERNRICIIDNGVADTLARAFDAFSSDDQSPERHYNVLDEILSALIWMFPLENGARKILRSEASLNMLICLMNCRQDFSSAKNAILVVKELCYDQEFVEALVSVEKVHDVLVRFMEEPISHTITKASLTVMFSMVSSSSSNHHERVKTRFVEMGVVSLLLNMLIDGENHLNEIALGVFDGILDCKEGREAAYENDLTMPVLVKKILRVSALATEYSVSSIWKLSRFEKQSHEGRVLFEALQVGAFQKLVLLLQCGCGDSTKEKATELLKLLNPYRAGLECIESADFKNLKRSF